MLAQRVIHADKTAVQMLEPGEKETHCAYVWAYITTLFSAHKPAVYDFSPSRAGKHKGMIGNGCMAHARKFFNLYVANKSQLAEQALYSIDGLYEVERQVRDMCDEERWRIRQEKAVPIIKTLHDWMLAQRDLVPNGSATAEAFDYSLKHWVALTRYLDDGLCPSTIIRLRTRYGHGHAGARRSNTSE